MIKQFSPFMKKYQRYLVLAVVCIVTETMFELIIPLIMANIVDVGVANGDKPYILQQGLLMALCALASLGLGIGSARFAAVCGQGFGAEIRKAEYAKIQSFSFANTDQFTAS